MKRIKYLIRGLLILLLLMFGVIGYIIGMEYGFLPLIPASILCLIVAGYWMGRNVR